MTTTHEIILIFLDLNRIKSVLDIFVRIFSSNNVIKNHVARIHEGEGHAPKIWYLKRKFRSHSKVLVLPSFD